MTQAQETLVKTYFANLYEAYLTSDSTEWDAAFDRLITKSNYKRACREFGLIAETEEAVALLWDYSSKRELEKLAKELEAAEAERKAAELEELVESTDADDAAQADANVESFPVAVEHLRDCFIKCYDDVEIYGCSMALTFLRCRLVKEEAREAWREVEDKYWEQFRFARQHNRCKGGNIIDEWQIAQEFAEAVLPLCKLDELKKLELDIEEEKKRAAICEECVELEEPQKVWTDEDFAIRPEDAYVETMKAVAVEDYEEPEPVEWTEYLAEYRKTRVKFHAKRMARDLAYFLETRGFTLDDCDKAEWWQTLAQRFWSLDDFIALAKAGGLKHIEDYLRNGRKLTTQKARRALLRIARAHTETCL